MDSPVTYPSRARARSMAYSRAEAQLKAKYRAEFDALYEAEKAKLVPEVVELTRWCPDCDKTLSLGRFYSFTRAKTGKRYWTTQCKLCLNARQRRNKELREARV